MIAVWSYHSSINSGS